MADWNRIGRALGGFAAGYAGDGPQYVAALQRADQMKLIEDERRRRESQERQQSTEQRTANQIRMARQRLEDSKNPVAALPLINEMLMGIPGADRGPLGQIKQSLLTSQTTGVLQPGQKEQILGQASQQLRALEDSFINRGLLQPEQPKEPQRVAKSDIIGGGVVEQNARGDYVFRPVQGLDPSQAGMTQRANYQMGATSEFQDEANNYYLSTLKFDPNTGAAETVVVPVGGAPEQPQGRLIRANRSTGETAGGASDRRINERAREQAQTAGREAFDRLSPIAENIAIYDEVISLLDSGADTGPVMNRLPSFRRAAVELDNLQKRLGLNVIQNTTFGALSENELKFALDSALPTGLQPEALKEWATNKRDAQQKLYNYISDSASFLLQENTTIGDWLEFQKEQQKQAEPQGGASSQYREGQTATNPQTGERVVYRNGRWEPL